MVRESCVHRSGHLSPGSRRRFSQGVFYGIAEEAEGAGTAEHVTASVPRQLSPLLTGRVLRESQRRRREASCPMGRGCQRSVEMDQRERTENARPTAIIDTARTNRRQPRKIKPPRPVFTPMSPVTIAAMVRMPTASFPTQSGERLGGVGAAYSNICF